MADDLEELCSDVTLPFEPRQMAQFLMRLPFAQPGTLKGDSLNDPQGARAARDAMLECSTIGTPVDVEADCAECLRCTAALAALAVQATEPDAALAHQIVAGAQSLLALAEAYRLRSAMRLRTTKHLAALRSRLDDCRSPDEPAVHPRSAARQGIAEQWARDGAAQRVA